jgi:hypothetical protein
VGIVVGIQQYWNQTVLDLIKFLNERPWWFKISILLHTALAAVTGLAEGLVLAQYRAVNVEWPLIIVEGIDRRY